MPNCFALVIDDDDACELTLFTTGDERTETMWQYAFEKRGDDDATLADFKARCGDEVADAMELCHCGWHTDEMVQTVPRDTVQAARAAVEALAYARDCLKAAGATRALDRARLALSSAKGAVRHAEGRATRLAMREVFSAIDDATEGR